jgi:hypothetical protein
MQLNCPNFQISRGRYIKINLTRALETFLLNNICNLDEMLLAFENLSKYIYEDISTNTVWVKELQETEEFPKSIS